MRRILIALAALSCLAGPASALDLELGAESDLWFDDNVYGTSRDEISDFSWTIAPTFELDQSWQTLTGELNVTPRYEVFFDEDRLSGWNYDANGSLEWEPTERATFKLTDELLQYRTLRGLSGDALTPVQPGREEFLRNASQLAFAYRTSPRGTLQLSTSYLFWQFDRRTRPDQSGTNAQLQYTTLVNERTRIGGAVSFSRQDFKRTFVPATHTDYYNASFNWNFSPAETFVMHASAGPTLVHKPTDFSVPSFVRAQLLRVDPSSGNPLVGLDNGSCPLLPSGQPYQGPGCDPFIPFPFPAFLRLLDPMPLIGPPPAIDEDSWTYFADVGLDKQWETAHLGISYRRDQGSGAALGFSSVADTIEVNASYQPIKTLSLSLNLSWENRQETQELLSSGLVTVLGTLPGTPTQPAVTNLVPIGIAADPVPGRRLTSQASVRSLNASLGADYYLTPYLKLESLVGWGDQQATRGSGFGDMSRVYMRIGLDFEFEPFRW